MTGHLPVTAFVKNAVVKKIKSIVTVTRDPKNFVTKDFLTLLSLDLSNLSLSNAVSEESTYAAVNNFVFKFFEVLERHALIEKSFS